MTGLESNGYYINNEIWISFPSYSGNVYFTLIITSSVGEISTFKIYANVDGTARVNIAPILKSMFPDNTTVSSFTIKRILSSNNASLSITRIFIKGGERTTKTNVNAVSNNWLTPSEKFPVFSGYPMQFYKLTNEYNRQEFLQSDVPTDLLDFKNTRGCNGLYFRFLNQMGGYSFWFFESHSYTESASNLGGYIRINEVQDLGSETNTSIKAFSKFPEKYKGIAKDLLVSSEIYIYLNGEYVRIRTNKNSFETDEIKRAYAVTFKFDIDYRFNPSELWSN